MKALFGLLGLLTVLLAFTVLQVGIAVTIFLWELMFAVLAAAGSR